MTDKPKDYSDLPDWPRLMMADLACRYVSFSRNGFLGRVGETWPEPIRLGGKVLWDKNALDEAVDRLSGGTEPLVDPFTEGIYRARLAQEAIKAEAELRGRKGKRRK